MLNIDFGIKIVFNMSETGEQKPPPKEIIDTIPVKRGGRIIHEPVIITDKSKITYGPDGKKRMIPPEEPKIDKQI